MIAIRPPEGYFDWPEEQRLEWIRQPQTEVLTKGWVYLSSVQIIDAIFS